MNLGKRFIFINFKLLSNIDELDDDDDDVIVVVVVVVVILFELLVFGTAAAFNIVVFEEEEEDNVPIGLLIVEAVIIPRPLRPLQVMLLPLLAEDRVRFERGSLLQQ